MPRPLGSNPPHLSANPAFSRARERGTALALLCGVLTILIADDEPHVVELVRVTLEDDRVRVFDAGDGRTALAAAEALEPDLLLLDVHLPDLSGLEVCRLLRKHPRLACTKIIMLTAAAQQDDIARGFTAGATDYLTKPFSPVRLLSLVERLLPQLAWPPA